MIECRCKKMENGEWGVSSKEPLTVGDVVNVSTKAGKSWRSTITVLHGENSYGDYLAEADKDWDSVNEGADNGSYPAQQGRRQSKPKYDASRQGDTWPDDPLPTKFVEGPSEHLDAPIDLEYTGGAECRGLPDLDAPEWEEAP